MTDLLQTLAQHDFIEIPSALLGSAPYDGFKGPFLKGMVITRDSLELDLYGVVDVTFGDAGSVTQVVIDANGKASRTVQGGVVKLFLPSTLALLWFNVGLGALVDPTRGSDFRRALDSGNFTRLVHIYRLGDVLPQVPTLLDILADPKQDHETVLAAQLSLFQALALR